MIDYQRAKNLLEETAHRSPQEIINHFVRTCGAWAGTCAQDDDVTFVILKIKDSPAGNGTHPAL